MEESTPNKRLIIARQNAGYRTASEAARAFGWNENTYRSHENAERGLKQDVLRKYSRAFRVDVSYLLGALPGTMRNPEPIPISGYVVDDGEIIDAGENRKLAFIKLNPIVYEGPPLFALEIKSGGLFGFMVPGDLLIFQDAIGDPHYSGRLVIVEAPDRRRWLRRLGKVVVDHADTFSLELGDGTEVAGVYVASLIWAVIPFRQWHSRSERAYVKDGL